MKGELRVHQKVLGQPGCADKVQDQINSECVSAALAGRDVVRLKIGDPYIFGRGSEEVLYFTERGIMPRVVPGVSSSLSAPLLAGIPLTHRGVSNRVTICTGYGRKESVPRLPKYDSMQSVVFLMAVGRLRDLMGRLVEAGYPAETPVGVVERAGCEGQRVVRGSMLSIADR